ncbi:MAG: hypothetical protein E7485_08270 [Ruminococcaceae bacterium]|nr:hypothetical protein [Oscillospiraceae bacterium]
MKREKIAIAMLAVGLIIAFDACAQAEYSMIWTSTFLVQGLIGTALAVASVIVSGAVSKDKPEKKGKRRP